MDFLTDPIFSDLGRSDFIGGIDNEALDFGPLDQFMQVAATSGNNNATEATTTNNNNNNVTCAIKSESLATASPITTTISNSNRSVATVSARVSLAPASAPIATPLVANNSINNSTHTHLPESPPDSGSEPPYSPLQDVHGLTLTSRDLVETNGDIYHGLSAGIRQTTLQQESGGNVILQPNTLSLAAQPPLHLSPQFTPPHHHQHHQNTATHPYHLSQPTQHYLNNSHHLATDRTGEIRIKHEAGLIMNASNLATQHSNSGESRIEMPTENQMIYSANSVGIHYEQDGNVVYAGTEYQNLPNNVGGLLSQAPVCMLNADTERVHVVGTPSTPQPSRSSAPSTPIHQTSSRKRKMSTQLDCADFSALKADPGLRMSPAAKSAGCSSSAQYPFGTESQKLSPTSPVSIRLPTPMSDLTTTTALSTASLSPALSTVNSNQENSMDGSVTASGSGENSDGNALTPCIRFSPFQPQNWHKLCDQNLQELSVVYYRVDADKGFNFSVSDDAFVCQKKNHFQVTCHARLQGEAKFVKTPSGLEKIKAFHLHFYGVKLESPNQTIRVEQSQSDRSKKPFYPVPIDLQSHIVSKITVGRLHFSETTNNNMRKKGRPNPEQRYFQLVVGLHVHTMSGNFPIISQGSERIIVRASNPGQFESDVDLCWQRGLTQDSIFHAGRVGINTDRPDESLVVHGNLKVSGHIVQPSDSRAKQEIGELDTSVQLRNLLKIRVVRYRYEPQFAIHLGLRRNSDSDSDEIVDTGVIAQEVQKVIPDAVKEAGSITLPNGNVIENFLLVNKDRILMENIGAVKELCKVTGSLESRIQDLEQMNSRLLRAKEYEQRNMLNRESNRHRIPKNKELCSNRNLQIIIFFLVIVMAACLAAVSTLYFMEHSKQSYNHKNLERLQQQQTHHFNGYHHDSVVLTDHEKKQLMHWQSIFQTSVNKTHPTWPGYLFGLTTPRTTTPTVPTLPTAAKNRTKFGEEISYNESGEYYASNGRTETHLPDELTVVMEKPLVNLPPFQSMRESHRISTSAPAHARNQNKTISSKHKIKWPLPHEVLEVAAQSSQKLIASNHANTNGRLANAPGITSNANIAVPPISTGIIHTSGFEEPLNASETSSEKVGETIPHDFENNSIDIDARQTTKKLTANNKIITEHATSSLAASEDSSSNSASQETSLVVENGDSDITLNVAAEIQNAHIVATTSSSNNIGIGGGVPVTTASGNILKSNAVVGGVAELLIYNVYKTVSPPTAASGLIASTNGHNANDSYTLDSPSLSNKSQGVLDTLIDTADALDLQNLSSNNDSLDNHAEFDFFGNEFPAHDSVVGRRSTNFLVQKKTLDVVGTPAQCKQPRKRDVAFGCQSVCFEDSNQLSSPRQRIHIPNANEKNDAHLHLTQNVDTVEVDDDGDVAEAVDDLDETPIIHAFDSSGKLNNDTAYIAPGKTSHATQAIAKQFSAEHQTSDSAEKLDTIPESSHLSESAEHLDNTPNSEGGAGGIGIADKNFDATIGISIDADRPPKLDCWKITSYIIADSLNHTFSTEDFCPNVGKSLNLTYIIPLSRYFKEPSLELQFTSSITLLWNLCHDNDHNKRDGKLLTPPPHNRHLHRELNSSTSNLELTIPRHGYFIRDVVLRASNDLSKENLCQEQANEANTLLQYNIRILRDCD